MSTSSLSARTARFFRDSDVRQRLIDKGFENVVIGASREWMRCTAADVKTAVTELQKGLRLTGTHHLTFPMRQRAGRSGRQGVRLLQLDLG